MIPSIPELVCPAGSLDKLKIAVSYGADGVYLAGENFGLRAACDNFTDWEIAEGMTFAHRRGARVYIALNGFLHDRDLHKLPSFIGFLKEVGVDGVILSDLGVLEIVKKMTDIPIHLSTQASCLNGESARFWRKTGVSRIILAREVSLEEAGEIKKKSGLKTEVFIHGSLCSAYSGHCVISNYTAGRDSNRGGCAHSCRFPWALENEQTKTVSPFMSSKDLAGLSLLSDFINHGIDSMKVEGRMKGHLYLGTVTKVYREALDAFKQGTPDKQQMNHWQNELEKVSHRDYTSGNLQSKASHESIFQGEKQKKTHVNIGTVVEVRNDYMTLMIKAAFNPEDHLELLPFTGPSCSLSTREARYLNGEMCKKVSPGSLVKLPATKDASVFNIVRKREEICA